MYIEGYLAIKMFAICSNMDRTGGNYASEISQTEEDKYWKLSLVYGI